MEIYSYFGDYDILWKNWLEKLSTEFTIRNILQSEVSEFIQMFEEKKSKVILILSCELKIRNPNVLKILVPPFVSDSKTQKSFQRVIDKVSPDYFLFDSFNPKLDQFEARRKIVIGNLQVDNGMIDFEKFDICYCPDTFVQNESIFKILSKFDQVGLKIVTLPNPIDYHLYFKNGVKLINPYFGLNISKIIYNSRIIISSFDLANSLAKIFDKFLINLNEFRSENDLEIEINKCFETESNKNNLLKFYFQSRSPTTYLKEIIENEYK